MKKKTSFAYLQNAVTDVPEYTTARRLMKLLYGRPSVPELIKKEVGA